MAASALATRLSICSPQDINPVTQCARSLLQTRKLFATFVRGPVVHTSALRDFYDASLLRRLTPVRAADFRTRIRSATAAAASSGDAAFSTSAISAEPTTAASAIPPSTVT